MKYDEMRQMFEDINRRLTGEGVDKSDLKELKKAFPSKALFQKEKSEKVMRQRQERLNVYFRKLITLALRDMDADDEDDTNGEQLNKVRMAVMILLTQYLIR